MCASFWIHVGGDQNVIEGDWSRERDWSVVRWMLFVSFLEDGQCPVSRERWKTGVWTEASSFSIQAGTESGPVTLLGRRFWRSLKNPFSLTSTLSMLGYGLSPLSNRLLCRSSSVKADLNWGWSSSALLACHFWGSHPGFSVERHVLITDTCSWHTNRISLGECCNHHWLFLQVPSVRLFGVKLYFSLWALEEVGEQAVVSWCQPAWRCLYIEGLLLRTVVVLVGTPLDSLLKICPKLFYGIGQREVCSKGFCIIILAGPL